MSGLSVAPTKESAFTCQRCGLDGRRIWGEVLASPEEAVAVYYVTWVGGCASDIPLFELVVGPWGEGSQPAHRWVASVQFNILETGPSFMVVDAHPDRYESLAAHPLRRDDIVGTDRADEVFAMLDAIWLDDPRVSDMHQEILNRTN